MMVQRALSAKSLSHAQGATLFAGYIKILPVFIMVLPGMISRVLYTDEVRHGRRGQTGSDIDRGQAELE